MQFECGESGSPLLPTKVTVEITNRLTDRYLAVQCKDKHHDLGVQQLNVGQTFSFNFYPNFFLTSTLYFCHFVWLEGDRYFNIYEEDIDGYCDHHHTCYWDILATGPCKYQPGPRRCFRWNPPALRKRLLLEKNNNTLSM